MRPWMITLLALLLGSTALADATLRFVESRNGERLVHILSIRGGKVRLEDAGDPHVILYDAEKHRLVLLDTAARIYRIIDEAEMRRQMESLEAMMAEIKAQLKGLPPEQRRAIERQLGLVPKPPEVKAKRGEERNLHGFSCQAWHLYRGKTFFQEVCLADARGVGISEEDYLTFIRAASALKGLARQASSLAGGRLQVMAADIEGIPVQVKDLTRGSTSQLAGVSTAPLDGGLFQIPEGFTPLNP